MDGAYLTTWHILESLVIVPIVLGNGLILISIAKFKKLQTSINVLVGNLALSDLIIGAVLIPCDFIGDVTNFNLNKYFCLGKLSLFVLSLGLSCYNLMLISVERFVAIVYPLKKSTYISKGRLLLMILFGWCLCLINSSLPLLGWNNYNNSTECVSDTVWTPGYKLCINWILLLASTVNVSLYAIVMRMALRRASRTSLADNMGVHLSTTTDIRQLVTMIIILGLFAVCWFPYLCLIVVVTFYETETTQFIRRCTLIPGLFNSAISWIVFGYRNKEFRKAFWAILKCQTCHAECESEACT